MRSLSSAQLERILFLLDSGNSATQIASQTGHSISVISKIRSQHRSSLLKSSGGRPSKLSPANIRHAVNLITSGKATTAVDITKTLTSITNQPLSTQTVCHNLKMAGMKAVVKKKKPKLTKKHKKDRLDFALKHQYWTIEDWKKIVWSDETKINRFGSDGKKWAWKKKGEGLSDRLIEPTIKFGGGSVMVWGCMLWDGVGYAVKIDGRMDGPLYVQIMEDDLQNSLEYYGYTPDNIIFQQDNDPKHTSGVAKTWFKDHGFEVLLWPAQSPDLNPIEHLWDYIKKKLGEYEQPPKGMLELWERIQEEWNKIPKEVCQNLIESMPRRVADVIKAKGGNTKY